MGVLACDRDGCENIMCDRLSNRHGYICDHCFEELVNTQCRDIAKFMDTPSPLPSLAIPREAYEEMFPWRNN